ncbi:MAG: hypothetical protein IPP71_19845 [Bacteroidetes bacterium]|nr:hypothetical protein [Bacteroidota bacterium]
MRDLKQARARLIRKSSLELKQLNENTSNVFSKFHRYDTNLIQMLSLREFYCASYEELNDPYDCRLQFTDSFIESLFKRDDKTMFNIDEIWSKFFNEVEVQHYKDRFTVIELEKDSDQARLELIYDVKYHTDFVNVLLNELPIKIICFTTNEDETQNDLLMWAHYAYSSNGVKLKFDFSKKNLGDSVRSRLSKVEYDGILPVNSNIDYFESIFHKGGGWTYENEYRMFTITNKKFPFELSTLVEIIFGFNVSNDDRESLIVLTSKLGYHNCKFSRMVFIKGKLTKIPIDYNPMNEYRFTDMMT